MLWACLLLPSLPLEVFARSLSLADAARPFAVATGGHSPRIVAVNDAARDAAIAPEQLVSAALARAPGIVLRDRDRRQETAALEAVAAWATQFTPAISLAPPDAVLAEIGGSLRLFGGLKRLTAELTRGARDLGYSTRLALAPTPLAALLLARADCPVTATRLSLLDSALAPLPLAHLDLAAEVIAMLATAGVTTFGQACALPRPGLARRAGADFVATLDRVRGLIPDPRPPFAPPARYRGRLDLPAPVANVEALTFATNRLVHELAGWLTGRGLGLLEMSLALAHERYVGIKTGVPATAVRFVLAAPTREPAHLFAVLRERLARVTLPASVESLVLASEATAPLAGRNLGLLPGDEAAVTVPLVDRLRARLGEDAVVLVAPRAEHRPERASGDRPRFPARSSEKPEKRQTWPVPDSFPPRPIWLLSEPAPLGHLLEAQPWVLRDGPERIESGWWDGADVRRDYFVAENPRGETVWIYRDHRYGIDDGEWFLHGVFA
jgi:protein ImuB